MSEQDQKPEGEKPARRLMEVKICPDEITDQTIQDKEAGVQLLLIAIPLNRTSENTALGFLWRVLHNLTDMYAAARALQAEKGAGRSSILKPSMDAIRGLGKKLTK